MNILQIKNLLKKFGGVAAVDRLSVDIEAGKITALIGPNGSGKSTLINTLTGIFPIDGGGVLIRGAHFSSIQSSEISDLGITRTFQEIRLWNQMSVFDTLLVAFTERGMISSMFERHNEFHHKQAQALLEKVRLWEKRNELVGNLSYGQRKLLEITRALAMNVEIYLFDEPFAGLFPEMTKIVVSILQELRAKGKTIILVEHNMDLIRQLADHVIVLDSGKLLAQGRPNEVLERREVIEAYLGE